MDEKAKKEKELRFYKETELKLKASSVNSILGTIKELRKTGNVKVLPLVFDLLETTREENIVKEVLILLGELKDNKTVPAITDYISKRPSGKYLGKVIAACWQSGLDFSSGMPLFVKCFIEGNYEIALESFTVIEEMIWRTSIDMLNACRETLINSAKDISEDKKPLYNELIKILNEGVSINHDEFPDLYLQ